MTIAGFLQGLPFRFGGLGVATTVAHSDIVTSSLAGPGVATTAAHSDVLTAGNVGVYKIAEFVLGIATASITFSSIPPTYRNLAITWEGACNNVGGGITLMMRLNGDAGTNYDWAENIFSGLGIAASADSGTGDTRMDVGVIGGTTSTGTSGGRIDIQNYAGTTLHKTAVSQSTTKNANTASNLYWKGAGAHWRSTAAITSVALFPSAGSFIAGFSAQLYGLM